MELYRNQKHNSNLKRRKETFFEMIKKLGYYETLEKGIEVNVDRPIANIEIEHDWKNKTYSSVHGNSLVIKYTFNNKVLGEFSIEGPIENQVVGTYEDVKKAGQAKTLEELDYDMLYFIVTTELDKDYSYYKMFNEYDKEENKKVDNEITKYKEKRNRIMKEYFGETHPDFYEYPISKINKKVSQRMGIEEEYVESEFINSIKLLIDNAILLGSYYYEVKPEIKEAINLVEQLEKKLNSSESLEQFKENRTEQMRQDQIRREQIVFRLLELDSEKKNLLAELDGLNNKGLR